MEFAFTEEQQMIRDTAAAFLAEVSDSGAVRRAMATEQGYDPELWQRICQEMYWQVELVATLEQMGRRLLCAPFFSTVCLGVNTLLVAGSDQQQERWLTPICAGELTATLACNGGVSNWGAQAVTAIWENR